MPGMRKRWERADQISPYKAINPYIAHRYSLSLLFFLDFNIILKRQELYSL